MAIFFFLIGLELKSEILIKSMAPYLESIDPFIDRQDKPQQL